MPLIHASFSVSTEELTHFSRLLKLLPDVIVEEDPVDGVPGLWARSGSAELHLNARLNPSSIVTGPSSPFHVCFAVTDLESLVALLRKNGYEVNRAGSLPRTQYWVAGPGAFRIELQSTDDS